MTKTQHDSHKPTTNSNGKTKTAPASPEHAFHSGLGIDGPGLGRVVTTDTSDEDKELSGRQLLALRKGKLGVLALALVLIGAAAAFGGALLWPPQYAARAEILYEISTEKPTGFLREDRSLTTQLVLLRSRTVLGPVAASKAVHFEDLQKEVTISLVDSSELIQVEVRADSPDSAKRRARAIVDRYLQVAPVANSSEAASYLSTQLADIQQKQERARLELARHTQASDEGASSAAEAHLQSLNQRQQQLMSQLDELKVGELGSSQPQVVAPPYALADPVSPQPLFAATAGALAGLVVAAAAIALLARRWTKR